MECEKCCQKIRIKCANITPNDFTLFKLKLDPYPWSCPRCESTEAVNSASDISNSSSLSAEFERSDLSTDDMTNEQTTDKREASDRTKIKMLIINLHSVYS